MNCTKIFEFTCYLLDQRDKPDEDMNEEDIDENGEKYSRYIKVSNLYFMFKS